MKTLCIVRHAKSSWEQLNLPDYNRPLLSTGVARTHKIIGYLKKQNVNPGLIISSHAVRARETAVMIAEGLSYPADRIKIEDGIYNGNEDDVLDIIFGVDNNISELVMVGHNPTFTNLANQFLSDPIDWMPTSGVACFEFNTDQWENIFKAKKRTKFVISPKLIREGKDNN